MNSTLIVARREFRSNFDSPIGYVVIVLSLSVVGALFFRDYWTINRASVWGLFQWLPWALLLLVIPATTMRLFSEEKRTGTLELLITMPVRDRDVVIGKFLATLGLVGVLLALTLTYPTLIYFRVAPGLDWAPILVGYLGLLLMSSAGIAMGLFFSSLTENQIIAFMLTAVTLFALLILGYLGGAVGGILGDIFSFIDFQRRMSPFGRGLLDLRNVVYFLSIAVFFLMLTARQLESRKWK